jgi:acyl-CoA thioester hydrolase
MQSDEIDLSSFKLVHTTEIDVRWRDLDEFGHVNNSVYLTYFEQARIEWWLTLDKSLVVNNHGPIIVTAACTFLKPLQHPDQLIITVHAGDPGKSSYTIYYEIFSTRKNILVTTGTTRVVWVDYTHGKSAPLPDRMRDFLSC